MGVDPGVVHTGVVQINLDPELRQLTKLSWVVAGITPEALDEVKALAKASGPDHVFIEKYRPRSNFGHDEKMQHAVTVLTRSIPGARALLNTGVTKVVTRELLQLLGLWRFSTVTHHQDLRSAARIAVLGMLKHSDINQILATVVADQLDGKPWTIA